jgi:hypothetical protein
MRRKSAKNALFASQRKKHRFLCILSAFAMKQGPSCVSSKFIEVLQTGKIAGSERTQNILERDKAIQLIRSLNQEAGRSMESSNDGTIYRGPFETFDLKNNALGRKRIDSTNQLQKRL